MLISGSRPVGRWFDFGASIGGGASVEEGSVLDRFILSGLILIALYVIYRRKPNYSIIIKNNSWLLLVYIFIGFSILWADFPYISFKRWVRVCGAVVMAVLVLSEKRPYQALESVFRRVAYILIPFSILLIKYFPFFGVEFNRWTGGRMWVGVSLQKNGLGQICTISASILIWSILQKWRAREIIIKRSHMYADLFIISMALFLLRGPGGAYSATSIAVLVTSMFLLVIFNKKESIRTGLITGHLKMLMVLFLIFIFLVMETLIPTVADILGRNVTLTGRTEIWNEVLRVAYRNPLIGVGFGSYWGLGDEISSMFKVNQAHNGYLGVFLELGIFGLILLIAFLLFFCGKVQREFDHSFDWGVLGLCFLVSVVLYNISESSFFQTSFVWSSIVFMSVILSTPNIYSNRS